MAGPISTILPIGPARITGRQGPAPCYRWDAPGREAQRARPTRVGGPGSGRSRNTAMDDDDGRDWVAMPGRTYGQACALALGLDLVGDRWTLLLVRELLVSPRRYSQLQTGLPGIPTNLLRDRLRRLEEDGIVERFEAPPPVDATLYGLTKRGQGLRGVVTALMRWGGELLTEGDHEGAAWPTEWPVLWLADVVEPLADDRMVVAISIGNRRPLLVSIDRDGTSLVDQRVEADLTIEAADDRALAALLTGRVPPTTAMTSGLVSLSGEPAVVDLFVKQLDSRYA